MTDLNPYIKAYIEKKQQINQIYLPNVEKPDGPTWYDRVKRAEHIADLVNRAFRHHQEEYEETVLDLREEFLRNIRNRLPPGARLEGAKIIFAPGYPSCSFTIE